MREGSIALRKEGGSPRSAGEDDRRPLDGGAMFEGEVRAGHTNRATTSL